MRLIFSIKPIFGLLLLLFAPLLMQAQNIQLTLGPDEIGENQTWTITITVSNEQFKTYDNFPEIPGFKKRGTSSQSTTNIINGQMSSSQSIIMTYSPTKQGIFTIAPFSLKVNDKVVNSPGKKIKVGPPIQRQQRDPFDSFFDRSDDFFGRNETEYLDLKDDAFLALTTNKDEVYVGEGFNAVLSLFVSENNKAPLQFYNLDKQVPEILKKIKPGNCWEENFKIENIEPESVTIQGKNYVQYKIYQSAYFPLNTEPVKFPAVGLEMIKYKVAKNPTFFGQNRKEDYKTFYTKAKVVKVKDLPPHPLKDLVAVGDYQLDEKIRSTTLETGQSTGYEFNIYGEGNISAIEKPKISSGEFEFYEPNVRQDVNRMNNRVTGTKSFSYFLIPKEPGQFKMSDYVNWVYFNPRIKKYDTLKSKLVIKVGGESTKNEAIQSNDLGTFYDRIESTDNTLQQTSNKSWQKWALNIFILLMLGASAYLVLKK
ncbi:MAG TPA: BatD family protein [Cyclobacteriaceae bacterium]